VDRRHAGKESGGKESAVSFSFTDEQLDMYGIRELQVLEEILRRNPRNPKTRRLQRTVCKRIRRKIAFSSPVPGLEVLPFLKAFYRAQRSRLEHRLLLRERREKKRQGRLGKTP